MPNKHEESDGQRRFFARARECGWYVKKLHGGRFQSGLPDCVLIHKVHGTKWVEFKVPGEPLRSTQKACFFEMHQAGAQIYVFHDEREYDLLFRPPNWISYVSNPGRVSLPLGFSGKEYRRDRGY